MEPECLSIRGLGVELSLVAGHRLLRLAVGLAVAGDAGVEDGGQTGDLQVVEEGIGADGAGADNRERVIAGCGDGEGGRA